MPIYEFYCERCNTIFNFFSHRINTTKIPRCPSCGDMTLKRRPSLFAAPRGDKADSETPDLPFDEARMEKAMGMMARDIDKIDENDPRQAAGFMRRLSDAAGLNLGDGMEEMLSRMEKGEDPEEIESQMGDLLEGEDPFIPANKTVTKTRKPRVDEKLYDL